ncbi:MAG: RtcB family protein [bacterium]|nr:RtcB family protein [bacterium]
MSKPNLKPLEIRGAPVDVGALDQIRRCLEDTEAAAGALLADHHLGYSMPIGGVIAYRGAVSPSGVGYDIACGNKAVLTDLAASDVRPEITRIMDEIYQSLEFGMGRENPEPVGHELFDDPAWRNVRPIGKLRGLAMSQLGTIGSGNHYVDIFRDEADRIWIGVHFGSRGFGHKTCTGFLNLAKGRPFDARPGGENMHAPATVFSLKSEIGRDYLQAMKLAGRYAYAGRDYVCQRVLEILGARALDSVHNHHNFAWEEEHGGEKLLIVRKGATPAWPGQRCFIGGSMGGISVIAEGVDTEAARKLLRSTVHGAGRTMSRTAAAGKKKWRGGRPIRIGGRFTRQEMNANMKKLGILLRGADTDEDPRCYKNLAEVLALHEDALKILHTLTPLGVAMAGADVRDDFRD